MRLRPRRAASASRDLAGLKDAICTHDIVLVCLDPLLSRLDVSLDTHKDAEVRLALEPLVNLANTTGACVLGLIHVNKSGSSDALTQLMASRAFAAVARQVLFLMTDPNDDSRRLLGVAKNNLGRVDLPTLAFTVEQIEVARTEEGLVQTGRLVWTGETPRSIQEALEAVAEASGDRTASAEAADWLRDYLISQDEPVESAVVKREAHKVGHTLSVVPVVPVVPTLQKVTRLPAPMTARRCRTG